MKPLHLQRKTKVKTTMLNSTLRLKKLTLIKQPAIALSLSVVLLSGCSYLEPYKAPIYQGNVMTEESVQLLQEGLSKAQVRQLFGPPQGAHPFNPNHWEYAYYSSLESEKTKNLTRHIVINFDKDGYLQNWQEKQPATPLKKDKSFLGLGWF